MANGAIRKEPLTKKERNNLFRRYMTFNAPGFDYVYYMGKSWPWWLKPFFKLFYNKEGYAENMSRHFDFYNCESGTAALLFGTILGLEERKALKGDVDEETIRSIKVGLQGPLAGIGDSLIQATLLPILMTITLALCAETGSIAGPLFYIVALFGIMIPYSYVLFNKGHALGSKAFDLVKPETLSRITEAISMFGLLVVGALAGKTCNCSLAVAFESNGESVMLIDKINAIFPNLLSLGVVFLLFWLMKYKKVSSIKIVFGVLIGVALLSLVGIV